MKTDLGIKEAQPANAVNGQMAISRPYYQDSAVTIYHGNCREILPTLPTVDLVLTDPPYGIGSWSANSTGGFMSSDEAKKISKWDASPPTRSDLLSIAALAPTIFWGGNYLDLPPAPKLLVWDKDQRGMHFAEVEVAWTNFSTGTSRILRCPLKSQEIFGVDSERQHPTQKPLKVMMWCLSLCPSANLILDPFMGSGTTLRAAKDLGRRAIGIEIEERYCEIAAKRMEQEILDFGASAICPVQVEEQQSPLLNII